MRRLWVTLLVLSAAGCSLLTPRGSTRRAPLDDEGEVFLYLEPWPDDAERLTFTLGSVAAQREDGAQVPLELALADVPGADPSRQRLFARGRLPPGSYRALSVLVKTARLASGEGPADLLVETEPANLPAPFVVFPRRATVVTLTFRYGPSVQKNFGFKPAFSVAVPARLMPQLLGFCSNTGESDLTLFDKRRREVIAIAASGRAPRGVVLAPSLMRAYAALSEEDQVEVIDVVSNEPLPRIRLTPGDEPRELAVSPDGRTLLVLNRQSSSLAFIDAGSGTEFARVRTGEEPSALLVDRSFRRAYVMNERSSSITVVDVANRAVAGSVATETGPIRAQLNRDGTRLYVIHAGSPQLLVFSLPGLAITGRVFVGLGASALKVDPRTDLIYVGKRDEGRLYVYDSSALIPVDFVDVPAGVTYLAIDDAENTLLALMPSLRAIAVLDLASRRGLGSIAVGEDAYSLAVAGER